VSNDPYGKRDKPTRLESVHRTLQGVNSVTALVTAVAFLVIGVGALIAASVLSEPLAALVGGIGILIGAVRLLLIYRLRR
jgi:hypothetical protein